MGYTVADHREYWCNHSVHRLPGALEVVLPGSKGVTAGTWPLSTARATSRYGAAIDVAAANWATGSREDGPSPDLAGAC